jgi:hypothetical protein
VQRARVRRYEEGESCREPMVLRKVVIDRAADICIHLLVCLLYRFRRAREARVRAGRYFANPALCPSDQRASQKDKACSKSRAVHPSILPSPLSFHTLAVGYRRLHSLLWCLPEAIRYRRSWCFSRTVPLSIVLTYFISGIGSATVPLAAGAQRQDQEGFANHRRLVRPL